ncbi:hypothetical protein Trydic_g19619 [Trypoxylus dichotomus]
MFADHLVVFYAFELDRQSQEANTYIYIDNPEALSCPVEFSDLRLSGNSRKFRVRTSILPQSPISIRLFVRPDSLDTLTQTANKVTTSNFLTDSSENPACPTGQLAFSFGKGGKREASGREIVAKGLIDCPVSALRQDKVNKL